MKLVNWLLIFCFSLTITACASSINARNANKYANAANSATKAGDWDTARKYWAKAVVNAELAKMSPKQLAVFNYEYGRALGVQCFFDESEQYLLKAFDLDQQTGGPEFMSLLELARLKYDQKQFGKAIPYYERTLEALEKADAPKQSPIGFADALDEYSISLKNIGNQTKAELVAERSRKLRSKNPQGYSITDRTPYGTKCINDQNPP